MDLELIFTITASMSLVGWAALLIYPLAPYLIDKVSGILLPILLGLAYASMAPIFFSGLEGGYDSLASVMLLFKTPEAVMAGWIHYLAFDLFIGAWQAREARLIGMSHIVILPALVLTLILGPIGLIVFFTTRLTVQNGRHRD
jgi:hypothetical protein